MKDERDVNTPTVISSGATSQEGRQWMGTKVDRRE